VAILRAPLDVKVEDTKFDTPLSGIRNSTAARREGVHTLPAHSPGHEQISRSSGNLEIGPPNCWVALLVGKYGKNIFKVRFLRAHIAAALLKHGADK
jgi:hypothetical protein